MLEWCEHHQNDPPVQGEDEIDSRHKRSSDVDDWDQKFMQVDQEMLFEIILASNYLDIKPLLDVGCKTVANMIKNKTADEIRKVGPSSFDLTLTDRHSTFPMTSLRKKKSRSAGKMYMSDAVRVLTRTGMGRGSLEFKLCRHSLEIRSVARVMASFGGHNSYCKNTRVLLSKVCRS